MKHLPAKEVNSLSNTLIKTCLHFLVTVSSNHAPRMSTQVREQRLFIFKCSFFSYKSGNNPFYLTKPMSKNMLMCFAEAPSSVLCERGCKVFLGMAFLFNPNV